MEKSPKTVYRNTEVPESMPKNPLNAGMKALEMRLSGAKKNKAMKPPKQRPMAQPDFVKQATTPKIGGRF